MIAADCMPWRPSGARSRIWSKPSTNVSPPRLLSRGPQVQATSEASPAAQSGAAAPPTPPSGERPKVNLNDPFTLDRYPLAVLLAIIYGFSPRLLIDRLTQSSN